MTIRWNLSETPYWINFNEIFIGKIANCWVVLIELGSIILFITFLILF